MVLIAAPAWQPESRISVLGSHYSELPLQELHERLLDDAAAHRSGYVCVANVHTTMMGFFDPSYRRITNESLYSIPDGMPLVWAMNSLGAEDQDRTRGPSLMREIADLGRAKNFRHYLYGGTQAALQALRMMLEKEYPGIRIVGAESPPFRAFEQITEAEFAATADRINSSGAEFVWIGLGAPKQERWMYAQRHRVQGIMLGVGAAFDLLSGRVPEAPAAFQALGLEWLYRLAMEPRRLWRRYLFNNPAFLLLWGIQLLFRLCGRSYTVRASASK